MIRPRRCLFSCSTRFGFLFKDLRFCFEVEYFGKLASLDRSVRIQM